VPTNSGQINIPYTVYFYEIPFGHPFRTTKHWIRKVLLLIPALTRTYFPLYFHPVRWMREWEFCLSYTTV